VEIDTVQNTYKTIALINPNTLKPPISPVGLEYIAEVLSQDGYQIVWIDLCFSDNWEHTLKMDLSNSNIDLIGITIRNLDEAMMSSQTFFVDFINNIVQLCRQLSNAPIFLGGAGFSITPCEILNYTQADFGLVGNGVNSISDFITAIQNQTYAKFPGCTYKNDDGKILINPSNKKLINKYPTFLFHRNFANLERYFQEGGQVGIETKRGCSQKCIYCVESAKEDITVELRKPESVLFEIEQLINRGINVFHWCDSEFNIPLEQALQICEAIIRKGINKKIKWYTYGSPVPFTEELAVKMEQAGCKGINFGVDSLHNKQLRLLQKPHRYEDIKRLINILNKTNIAVMFDLLIGGPGETKETALFTIEHALKLKPHALGIAVGVRLYPYTVLGQNILSLYKTGHISETSIHGKPIEQNKNLFHPTYYLSEKIDTDFFKYLSDLVKNNPSVFLSLPANEEGSYSYCNHDYLTNAIKNGSRGAYWDILRKRKIS